MEGPGLVDPGPSTTLPQLKEGLRAHGLEPGDLRHVFLTHVHLDHGGATGHLARDNPDLAVHVHADGAPHLQDPTRLVASTRRTFGALHDRLWGEVLPVPPGNLRPWRPEAPGLPRGIEAIPTPGHIAHHLAWHLPSEGTLLCGDALGILLHPDAPTHPATPPPSVDLEAWAGTLRRLATLQDVERIGVAHFGWHTDLAGRAIELLGALTALGARVWREMTGSDMDGAARRYDMEVRHRLGLWAGQERMDRYFGVFPATSDWEGIRFHLERAGWPGAL